LHDGWSGDHPATATARKLEVLMKQHTGIEHAVLSGDVHLTTEGGQAAETSAGLAVLNFSGKNVLTKVHAEQQVKLQQQQRGSSSSQEVEVTAPATDQVVDEVGEQAEDTAETPAETTLYLPFVKTFAAPLSAVICPCAIRRRRRWWCRRWRRSVRCWKVPPTGKSPPPWLWCACSPRW
jgi:hypothetical protein